MYCKKNDRELERQEENERRRNKKKDKRTTGKTVEAPIEPEPVPPD